MIMSRIIEELEKFGCDIEGAMMRMSDDEDFYIECLSDFVGDGCFDKLGTALEARNVRNAFEAAHTLKGLLANLGLTPMYNCIVEIVEPLRSGSCDNLEKKYSELIKMNDSLKKILTAE